MFFILLLFKMVSFLFLPFILIFSGGKIWEFWKNRPKEYKQTTGKTYKQCAFCGMKADGTANRCPRCKKTF
jgi:uncharacterized paraquat-inducible protein A